MADALMGRTPDPINTRAARGTLRQGEAISAVTALVVALPDPPPWLKGEGLAYYRRLGAQMVASETVTVLDAVALAVHCEAWATYVHINQQIAAQRADRNRTLYALRRQRGALVRLAKREDRPATADEMAQIDEIDRKLERLADWTAAYTPNGMSQVSALFAALRRARQDVERTAAALGLSPTTRAKATRVTKDAKADEDELAAWAQKRGG